VLLSEFCQQVSTMFGVDPETSGDDVSTQNIPNLVGTQVCQIKVGQCQILTKRGQKTWHCQLFWFQSDIVFSARSSHANPHHWKVGRATRTHPTAGQVEPREPIPLQGGSSFLAQHYIRDKTVYMAYYEMRKNWSTPPFTTWADSTCMLFSMRTQTKFLGYRLGSKHTGGFWWVLRFVYLIQQKTLFLDICFGLRAFTTTHHPCPQQPPPLVLFGRLGVQV